jgi:hypothetical protein
MCRKIITIIENVAVTLDFVVIITAPEMIRAATKI